MQWIFSSCKAEEGAYAAEHKQLTTTQQGGKRPSKTDAMLCSAVPQVNAVGSVGLMGNVAANQRIGRRDAVHRLAGADASLVVLVGNRCAGLAHAGQIAPALRLIARKEPDRKLLDYNSTTLRRAGTGLSTHSRFSPSSNSRL